jgi:hypothetical protein
MRASRRHGEAERGPIGGSLIEVAHGDHDVIDAYDTLEWHLVLLISTWSPELSATGD